MLSVCYLSVTFSCTSCTLPSDLFQSAFSALYLIWPGFSRSSMFQKLIYQTSPHFARSLLSQHLSICRESRESSLVFFTLHVTSLEWRKLSAACELGKGIFHRISKVSLGPLSVWLSYSINKFIIRITGRLSWFKIFQLPELRTRSVKEQEYGVYCTS